MADVLTHQPKQQIDIDIARYSGESGREALNALYDQTLHSLSEGSIVLGRVVAVRDSDVLVDIKYKSEGVIPLNEFRDTTDLAAGDEIEVLLEHLEDDHGRVVLSKAKAELQRNWDNILENYNEGDVIEGIVRSRVKGGLIVDVGVDAFLPGSQIDLVPVRNPDDLLGNSYNFKVIKINLERRNIVVSRRELLEEERRAQKQQLLSEITQGEMRTGLVKNITDFGAFIDLSGLDGLLHITDMTWGRINHPSELVTIGQELSVMILEVDLEKERVSLGLKQKSTNPWDGIEAKFPIGSRVSGKVVNLMPYGAFIELEEGVEGLVHVSEMSWTKRITRAADAMELGDEVEAVVLQIDQEQKKISLGIRQTERNPWEMVADSYPIGSKVQGKVRNFTNYGAFVEMVEGVDGMIHVSDMSWTRKVNHPSEILERGEEVEAVVLEVDIASQRISLGLKQAQEDPWSGISSKYSVGQLVSGKIAKIATFGAFVEIEEGVEGLVHISQLSEQRVEKVRDVVKLGDEVSARIIKIDAVERRIGLSVKAAAMSDEDFELDESYLEGLRPGEDLVDLAGAFDEAFGALGDFDTGEAWHPGQAEEGAKDAPKADEEEGK